MILEIQEIESDIEKRRTMIEVYFGLDKACIRDIHLFFENVYDEEWLDDPFVQSMIQDVDHSRVVSRHCIMSPVFGQIPPERLSGGVKALICFYKMEDAYIDLIVCGENCEKWIAKIAAQKNIRVGMSGYDLTFSNEKISGICLNDQTEFHNAREWTLKMCMFVDEEDEGE